MKLIIDIDPTDSEFFAIWTDIPKAINCTVAESIGSREDAEIMIKALKGKYDRIESGYVNKKEIQG